MTAWATTNGVDVEGLKRFPQAGELTEPPTPVAQLPSSIELPVVVPLVGGDSRPTLAALIQSLDDTELRQVLVSDEVRPPTSGTLCETVSPSTLEPRRGRTRSVTRVYSRSTLQRASE